MNLKLMVRRVERGGPRGLPGVAIAWIESPEGHMMLDGVGSRYATGTRFVLKLFAFRNTRLCCSTSPGISGLGESPPFECGSADTRTVESQEKANPFVASALSAGPKD
jgi:hypothetical protein